MSTKNSPLLLVAWMFVIAGCQTPSDEPGSGNPSGGEYSTIKPGAAVALDYAVEGETEPGTAVTVRLDVTSANAVDRVDLSLNSDDSLQLGAEDTNVQFQDVLPGIVQTHRLMVTPQRSGRLFINVIVTVDSAGTQAARTFSVPIQVGPEVADKDAAPLEEDGERIISLPAEES